MNLQGKIALITGASKGIGKAIAFKLAHEGASVAVNYSHDDQSAEETVNKISSLGGKAIKFKAKVEQWTDVQEMVHYIKGHLGDIDILVNNAGVVNDAPIVYMKPEDFYKVVEVNLFGCFNCSKAVALSMIKRKRGRIINISSVSGLIGAPGQCNYSASKGGIISFTKSLARELAMFDITVNAIAPGFISTGIAERLKDEIKKKAAEIIPLGKFGIPEDVASTVAFLTSDEAGYITGETLVLDGGLSLQGTA